MNAQQALEYSMQPFIPMFIYGDYDAMESERQRGEEAIKALIDEWRSNDEPGFGFDVILDLADRNRELCDQIGEARPRNLSSPLLARNLSDADLCAAIGKMQGRATSAVARAARARQPASAPQAACRAGTASGSARGKAAFRSESDPRPIPPASVRPRFAWEPEPRPRDQSIT